MKGMEFLLPNVRHVRQRIVSCARRAVTELLQGSLAERPAVLMLFSARDRWLADELHGQLQLLEKHLTVHRVDHLPPGDNIAAAMANWLRDAEIVLALLSVDFFADRLCRVALAKELLDEPEGHLRRRVIPIPLRPCNWRSTPLGALAPLPASGQPLSLIKDGEREAVMASIADNLRLFIARRDAARLSCFKVLQP